MLDGKIEQSANSLVLLGSFNPEIFQPFWLSKNGLVGESEANEAEVHIIHKDASIIEFTHFTLEITREKFTLKTTGFEEIIWDLFKGVFQVLHHTPLSAIGINYEFHFSAEEDEILEFEKRYCATDAFNAILENPDKYSFLVKHRPLKYKDSHQVVKYERWEQEAKNGMYFLVNNHIPFTAKGEPVNYNEIKNNYGELLNSEFRIPSLEIVKKLWNKR